MNVELTKRQLAILTLAIADFKRENKKSKPSKGKDIIQRDADELEKILDYALYGYTRDII